MRGSHPCSAIALHDDARLYGRKARAWCGRFREIVGGPYCEGPASTSPVHAPAESLRIKAGEFVDAVHTSGKGRYFQNVVEVPWCGRGMKVACRAGPWGTNGPIGGASWNRKARKTLIATR